MPLIGIGEPKAITLKIHQGEETRSVSVARKIRRRSDTDPRAGLRKYGDTTFADPVNKKYPIDTPGRIKAAWAYIHQPSNSGKYASEDLRTIKTRVRQAAKARGVKLPDPG